MNIPATIFKNNCLRLMNDVQKYQKEIIITKFGKPVAKLVPMEYSKNKPLFGYLKDHAIIKGDIISPTQEWASS